MACRSAHAVAGVIRDYAGGAAEPAMRLPSHRQGGGTTGGTATKAAKKARFPGFLDLTHGRNFRHPPIGGVAGNPRIRNRTSLLGRLQVGEFSSIIGLIRRAQSALGRVFSVSGVICAFRKRALEEAGWWSPRAITDDIDVTWRLQVAGWRVAYEPHAIAWVLMPETLKSLWKQHVRWAEGGVQMMVDYFRPMVCGARLSLLPTYINYLLSLLWAYLMTFCIIIGLLWTVGLAPPEVLPGFQLISQWWGLTLAITYLAQGLVTHLLERRFEPEMLRSLFWMMWYPMAFWIVNMATAVVALPTALLRPRRATWTNPDRGFR